MSKPLSPHSILSEDLEMLISSDSSDRTREEMKWTDQHESLLSEWRDRACGRSRYHGHKGKGFQVIFAVLGIPSVVIPMCTGIVSEIETKESHIVLIMSVILACLNGILTFLNPGKKSVHHYQYESEFASFVVTIDVLLSKAKKYRTPADVTLERLSSLYNKLVAAAPP